MKKTLKTVVSLALSAVVATSTALSAGGDFYTLQQVNFPIYSNGYLIEEGDLPTLSLSGNTYVPLRKLAESASVDVNWNNDTGAIEVKNKFIAADAFRKVALVEAEYELLYLIAVRYRNSIVDTFFDYTNGNVTISYLKAAMGSSDISVFVSRANKTLNYCFPNGLSADTEYEKKLNDFIYNTNVCVQTFNDTKQLINDFISNKYTATYTSSKIVELDKNFTNYMPTSLSQRHTILSMLNGYGY